MSLSDRKIKILQAIINDYIATAEPVGSRTIAKKYDFGLSSATIRNEMSDLEEMGFIIQPHASSGRIPSDLGYRLYVDSLMQQRDLVDKEKSYLHGMVAENVNQIEYLMEETAKMLSTLTNYTTIISEPIIKSTRLKKIRFMSLDEKNVMIIIAADGNIVKNHMAKVDYLPNDDELYSISCVINECLEGQIMESIDLAAVDMLYTNLSGYDELITATLRAIEKTVRSAEKLQLHLSGAKNILAFPEFSDVQKAKSLIQTLEDKESLKALLSTKTVDGKDLQIYIGNENGIEEMKDCSIITTSYKFADNITGTIGILGPTRMNYSQVVSVLNAMAKNIENVVSNLSNQSDKEKNDS
ncbi:MAG TPA: heat-inducible transcription repressor HrcA [Lachnospiraceae bacterium]|jgi:heat shock gene repressor HrcA|nr:heat-inducible transcription repressor HrcA [Lachnospiraceae bacterium]